MENVAIYYENTIIYWNNLILIFAFVAALFIGASFYIVKKKKNVFIFVYYPVAAMLSLVLARLIHWYCHTEQYESFTNAINLSKNGGYNILGVLLGTYLTAALFYLIKMTDSRKKLLDAVAPSIAFFIACIRFSDRFTDVCRGKRMVEKDIFKIFPFAVKETGGDYRLAVFDISFVLLIVVTAITIFLFIRNSRLVNEIRKEVAGDVYRLFLVLYGGTEIVTDSMRNDASHLFFPGEHLAGLNKGAGFMGLSQLAGAVCCLCVFIYFVVRFGKVIADKDNKVQDIIRVVCICFVFFAGFTGAGISEYLVQRHGSMFVRYYVLQGTGVLMMLVMTFSVHHLGIKNMLIKERVEE